MSTIPNVPGNPFKLAKVPAEMDGIALSDVVRPQIVELLCYRSQPIEVHS